MSEPISYVGKEAAKRIVSKAKEKFSPIEHKHLKSDITDLIIDSELSSTSTNPVQNKIVFNAIERSAGELSEDIKNRKFYINITNNDGTFSADKTIAEIDEAYADGKFLYCIFEEEIIGNMVLGMPEIGYAFSITLPIDEHCTCVLLILVTADGVDVVERELALKSDIPEIDTVLNATSDNAVSNKAVYNAITSYNNLLLKLGSKALEAKSSNSLPSPIYSSYLFNEDMGYYYSPKTFYTDVIKKDGTSYFDGYEQVTAAEKAEWNAKSEFSGKFNDLSNKPTTLSGYGITDGATKSELNSVQENLEKHANKNDIHFSSSERTKLSGIESGAQKNTITGIKGSSEQSYRTGQVNITKENIGLDNVDNTSDANKPVSTKQAEAINKALGDANGYTDEKIALLLNNSSEAVDSIMELAIAMEENDDVVEALEKAVGNKADKTHSHNGGDITINSPFENSNESQLDVVLENFDACITGLKNNINGKANTSHAHKTSDITYDGTSGNIVGKGDTLNSILQNYDQKMMGVESGVTNSSNHIKDSTIHVTQAEKDSWSEKADKNHTHSYDLSDIASTNAPWEYISGNTAEDMFIDIDTKLSELNNDKAGKSHTHTITAGASDDSVVILTGTNGTNKVTYSASHVDSGVTAGTYKSVTVDKKGHVTAGTNPTTLSGYGITDAYTKIEVEEIVSGKSDTNHTHTADSALSTSSTNPVQNQAVTNWLAENVKNYQLSFNNDSGNIYLDDSNVSTIASEPEDGNFYTTVYTIANKPLSPEWKNIRNIPSASTSTMGIVQLTNSTSSTSTSTAATPNSVKSAYDLANNANTLVNNMKPEFDELLEDAIRATNEGEAYVSDGSPVKNEIAISTDINGNLFVGDNGEVGYKNGYRWSNSNKVETKEPTQGVTGFIPCKHGDTLRLKNVTLNALYPYIVYFDSSKNVLGTTSVGGSTDSNGVTTTTLSAYANVGFIRLALGLFTPDSLATINYDFTLSGTVQVGWIVDKDNNKIVPKTLSSQVVRTDGTNIENYIDSSVEIAINESNEYTDIMANTLEQTIANKVNNAELSSHVGNIEVHVTQSDKNTWNAKASAKHSHTTSDIEYGAPANILTGNTLEDVLMTLDEELANIKRNKANDSDLTNHKNDTAKHITSEERTQWNSGVRKITAGTTKGTITVNTGGTNGEIPITGLKSAAYTDSSAYDAAGSASEALSSAKTYTNEQIGDLSEEFALNLETLESNVVSKSGDTMNNYLYFERNVNDVVYKAGVGISSNGNFYLPHYTDGTLDNYITLSNVSSYTLKPWTIASGGTNATTASGARSNLGLGNVENKSSATIRSEITKDNVVSALGYEPPTTNTTYSEATTSKSGLMSSSDKSKLNNIAANANNYSLPTASSSTLGGVKTTSSVTSTSGLTACPIISGVPYYKNTTYGNATTSSAGLMSASDKSKLDGLSNSGNTLEYEIVELAIGSGQPTVTISQDNSRYYPSLGMMFIDIQISFTTSVSEGTDMTGSNRPIRFTTSKPYYPANNTPLNCHYNSTMDKELRACAQSGNSNSYGIGLYVVDKIAAYDNFFISGWYIVG